MHNLSLVLFTVFAQAAVGMVVLLAIWPIRCFALPEQPLGFFAKIKHPRTLALLLALILFGAALVFSLLHLSDPFISYYSVANVGTSWLSREIIMVGLFGLSSLIMLFSGKRLVALVAAIFGIGLVYVMSMIYMTPPIPFWSSNLTLLVFACTALLLGSATLLVLQSFMGNMAGGLPILVVLAAGLRLGAGIVQLVYGIGTAAQLPLFYAHIAGVALALVVLFVASKMYQGEKARPVCAAGFVFVGAILFWAAELAARVMFYASVTSLTM